MAMALTLVINPGSSSKKYALYREGREVLYVSVTKEATDIRYAVCKNDTWLVNQPISEAEYGRTIELVLQSARQYGCLQQPTEVTQVGVRIVAPGEQFQLHQVLHEQLLHDLQANVAAAPLHIPPTLSEIKAVKAALPAATIVAVTDSAFHNTLPPAAYRSSIPAEDTTGFGIRRYGYHGLSVASIVRRVHAVTGQNYSRLIVCHLGSGASVTAVQDGVSVETSMGFSPGSGLVMSSRAGDLEPGALLELMRLRSMNPHDAYTYLQTRGGLQALAGEADIRHLLERVAKQDSEATIAFERFAHCVKKQVGAMMAVLGGLDALVITATAGERSPALRQLCFGQLGGLGITISAEKNDEMVGREGVISLDGGKVKVVVMKTDEMGEMQRVTEQLVP